MLDYRRVATTRTVGSRPEWQRLSHAPLGSMLGIALAMEDNCWSCWSEIWRAKETVWRNSNHKHYIALPAYQPHVIIFTLFHQLKIPQNWVKLMACHRSITESRGTAPCRQEHKEPRSQSKPFRATFPGAPGLLIPRWRNWVGINIWINMGLPLKCPTKSGIEIKIWTFWPHLKDGFEAHFGKQPMNWSKLGYSLTHADPWVAGHSQISSPSNASILLRSTRGCPKNAEGPKLLLRLGGSSILQGAKFMVILMTLGQDERIPRPLRRPPGADAGLRGIILCRFHGNTPASMVM